jgi:tetratricopeptide (TPR) repeat protein
MVKKKKTDKAEERLEVVEEALSKSERFIENNQKSITTAIVVIVVLVLGYFGVNRYYFQPRQEIANEQMFMAEKYFESDSLNKALYGDGNNMGFLDIIDEYKMTKAANLARYYAGIIYLKQGDFEEAIAQLRKFKSRDNIVRPIAIGAMGDAYLELNQPDKAISQYLSAARASKNELTAPLYLFRAAQVYEIQNNFTKALEIYEQIQREYYTSNEGRMMDKYIVRARILAGK